MLYLFVLAVVKYLIIGLPDWQPYGYHYLLLLRREMGIKGS